MRGLVLALAYIAAKHGPAAIPLDAARLMFTVVHGR